MKLGVAYNLFDGEELLEYSIKHIRDKVDFISVIYQKVSYQGNDCNDTLEELLLDLKSRNLVDEIYLYTLEELSNDEHNIQLNETNKRNIGLELSKRENCTHHMTMDVDEFYTNEEFSYMKEIFMDSKYDVGYCKHIQYYKDSKYIKLIREEEFVSTINKINEDTKYIYKQNCVVPVDPTRKTNNTNFIIFNREQVQMHHMSYVRKNIKTKLLNSSARQHFSDKQIDMLVEHYENWTYPDLGMWGSTDLIQIIEVPKLFEIYT